MDMFSEFKYSVWALALKLFGVYIAVVVVNLLVLSGLLGIFQNNAAWTWFVQAIALLINFGLIFMFCSSDGRRDILVDGANEKRAQRVEGYTSQKVYDERKGFVAGAVAMAPFIILFLVWLLTGKEQSGMEFFVRLSFSPYFQFLALMDVTVLSVILFVMFFTGISGLAYISAKSYRKKVLTIIKRNEEKAQVKGIVRKEEK